jgi:hypothetical protein
MRSLLLLAFAVGCGDGSRGGSVVAPIDQQQMDGVDKGEGVDNGREAVEGADAFAACSTQSDCSRGTCIEPERSRPGICLAICAAPFAPSGEGIGAARIEPCVGLEQCVVLSSGAGLCLRPCSTSAECPTGTRCSVLEDPRSGTFCVPTFSSSTPVEEPVEATPPSSGGGPG